MSIECRIYFNTSFRNTMESNDIPYFFNEGYCELYGAGILLDEIKNVEGIEVKYLVQRSNEYIYKDSYGNPLKMYSLEIVLNILENAYTQYLKEGNKSSLTVCIGILKAIKENSSQSNPMVMLEFK